MELLNIDVLPFATVPYRSAVGGGRSAPLALPLLRGRVDRLPPGLEAVLVTSDLQGRVGAALGEALATEVRELSSAGEVPPPDRIGVIFAGDLFATPGADVRGASGDVTAVWAAFARDFRWVVGVPGNHDVVDPGRIGRGRVLDGDLAVCDGLRLAGLGGIVGNPAKPQRRTESGYDRALRGLLGEEPDLLVVHEGPAGGDGQRGRSAINDAVDGRVGTVVCGHVHWQLPLARLARGTVVLNVDARVVVLTT